MRSFARRAVSIVDLDCEAVAVAMDLEIEEEEEEEEGEEEGEEEEEEPDEEEIDVDEKEGRRGNIRQDSAAQVPLPYPNSAVTGAIREYSAANRAE
jgi:hypothetical protein